MVHTDGQTDRWTLPDILLGYTVDKELIYLVLGGEVFSVYNENV